MKPRRRHLDTLPPGDTTMTLGEVAAVAALPIEVVKRMARDGVLPAVYRPRGRIPKFPRSEVLAWLRARAQATTESEMIR